MMGNYLGIRGLLSTLDCHPCDQQIFFSELYEYTTVFNVRMTDQNVECSVKITFVLVNNIIEFELIIIKVIGLSQKSNLLK